VPEKRRIKFALIDLEGIRQRTTVTPQEVQKYYEDNKAQYATPEQLKASHILLKTEGKDDAAVKKQAEALLAQVKGGADFEALAKKVSEDPVSGANGGDLGFFAPGDMVKEFSDAAVKLAPGEISELVKSQFGYHIIKGGEKKPASQRTLDEVRAQIEDTLKAERAQQEADRLASDLAGKLPKPEDLDTVAKQRGLTVAETPFFARTDALIPSLGLAPAVAQRAFEMKPGEVSDAVRIQQGYAFVAVTGIEESKLPTLDEVRARVRDDLQKTKAVELARQKAAAALAAFKSGDFNAAAKSAGVEVKTTDLIARGAALPDIGMSPAVDAAAFALPQGGVSEPVVTDTGAVIVKVLEKQAPTADEIKNGRSDVRAQLLNQQKQRFFASYMAKARERMNIRSNPDVLAQMFG
jgi:peptidyl-prolyl cis-trans isomerase D